jgi:hypothetical protein
VPDPDTASRNWLVEQTASYFREREKEMVGAITTG